MNIVCLDLEGVLVPEIWIAFAEKTGISEFRRTTRDEPDYDKLMRYRLDLLERHSLGIKEIQDVIATIEPLEGAKEFLDELRERTQVEEAELRKDVREFLDSLREIGQVLIISDTFAEFAQPLMRKLGWPTIFCNSLEISPDGRITGYRMRCPQSKLTTVKSFQSCGMETIAAGDSFNDLGMIRASKAGFLFRAPEKIKADNPDLPAFETYEDFLAGITGAL